MLCALHIPAQWIHTTLQRRNSFSFCFSDEKTEAEAVQVGLLTIPVCPPPRGFHDQGLAVFLLGQSRASCPSLLGAAEFPRTCQNGKVSCKLDDLDTWPKSCAWGHTATKYYSGIQSTPGLMSRLHFYLPCFIQPIFHFWLLLRHLTVTWYPKCHLSKNLSSPKTNCADPPLLKLPKSVPSHFQISPILPSLAAPITTTFIMSPAPEFLEPKGLSASKYPPRTDPEMHSLEYRPKRESWDNPELVCWTAKTNRMKASPLQHHIFLIFGECAFQGTSPCLSCASPGPQSKSKLCIWNIPALLLSLLR